MSFRVAVNEKRKDKQTTTYYDVTGVKTGVFDLLKKGQGVVVNGKFSITTTQKDDKEFVYAKAKIDEKIRSIVGEKNFVSWEVRYGQETV